MANRPAGLWHERKTIHVRLKEVDGVETGSEGTEPNRFVVILPIA